MEQSESGKLSNDERLEQIIADYLQAAQSGPAPDRDALLQEHPDLADELRAFFANHDRMHAVAQPFRPAAQGENLPDAATLPPRDSESVEAPAGQRAQLAAPPIGTKVRYFGDYELLEEIARGGMGVVYKARQVKLNRIVALKMILAGQFASQADVGRFYTEAEAAANLDHPGIVPIFEVGEHEGQHFFSMGYIDGQSLATKLADGPLPPRQAAELLKQVAEAVQYAHDEGVIHRDLKPANILLKGSRESRDKSREQVKSASSPQLSTLNPQPMVTDFGLAKRVQGDSGMTATGEVLGTPSYMPPEQAAGRIDQVREAADVYALGAVLYASLTGRPPFQADNPLDTLLQVLEREPVAPRQVNPSVPRDLETICLKCLQKERRRRYASARALADDLERYLRGEPIHARPVGRGERAAKWVRRHPAVSALVVLVVLSLIAGTTVSTLFAIQSGRNAENYFTQFQRSETLAGELSGSLTKQKALSEGLAGALTKQKAETKRAEGLLTEKTRLSNDLADALTDQKAATHRAERLLYVSQIGRAHSEWNSDNPAQAWQALDACRADLRGWEHDYLYTLFTDNQRIFRGHRGPVNRVAFSSDGKLIVSGSDDRTLKVWDAMTGRPKRTLRGHTRAVRSVAFSPDGTRIVSGSDDGTLRVWDATTGEQPLTFKGHSGLVRCVAFSPDGTRIVSGSNDRTAKVWDANTGQEMFTFKGHEGWVPCVAFSPDGTRIVSGSGWSLKVWDAATGQEILTLPARFGAVRGVAFSPDGTRIVSGSGDRTVKVWDAATGQAILTLTGHRHLVACVDYSPDGERIVSASHDGTIKVWDAATGEESFTLKGHAGPVQSVAFSPDGTQIVSGSDDGTLRVWEVAAGEPIPPIVASGGPRPSVHSVAFSPDGTQIVGGIQNGLLKIWDADSGRETLTSRGRHDGVLSVALGPDGKQIVSGGRDQTVKLWDATTGREILTLKGHTGLVHSVDFSPDGKWIVSGSADKTVKVWEAATGAEMRTLEGHTETVRCVAYSPLGTQIVSGSNDRTLRVWDASTGEPTFTMPAHQQWVSSVAFSHDGKRIVSGYADINQYQGHKISVWDAATGRELLDIQGRMGAIHSVAFSPDGTRIVSGNEDGTLKLWDAATGRELLSLEGHAGAVLSVAFSPDGKRIVSGSVDGTLRFWEATRSQPAPEERLDE